MLCRRAQSGQIRINAIIIYDLGIFKFNMKEHMLHILHILFACVA